MYCSMLPEFARHKLFCQPVNLPFANAFGTRIKENVFIVGVFPPEIELTRNVSGNEPNPFTMPA